MKTFQHLGALLLHRSICPIPRNSPSTDPKDFTLCLSFPTGAEAIKRQGAGSSHSNTEGSKSNHNKCVNEVLTLTKMEPEGREKRKLLVLGGKNETAQAGKDLRDVQTP